MQQKTDRVHVENPVQKMLVALNLEQKLMVDSVASNTATLID